MASSSRSHDHLLVDMKIWKIIAEPFPFNPKIGSRVFYFPEGHGEHSCSSVEDWPSVQTLFNSSYLCKILSVDFLADAKTEELFLRLTLAPVKGDEVQEQHSEEEDMGIEGVFNKRLTNTDVNVELRLPVNASDVFLDHDQDSNFSLKVSVTDFHGIKWYFNHNYQNNNNRYVLSAGWKKFVKEKNLTTGDSVVFVKNLAEEIFVGMQRKSKIAADEAAKETKSKNVEAGLPAYNVMVAMNQIQSGHPFEVVFHPNYCDFLVDPKYIQQANDVIWRQGMKVSFVKRDGSSQTGSIAEVCNSNINGIFSWRMLKMKWDDEVVDPVAVNPWEVQIIPNGDV